MRDRRNGKVKERSIRRNTLRFALADLYPLVERFSARPAALWRDFFRFRGLGGRIPRSPKHSNNCKTTQTNPSDCEAPSCGRTYGIGNVVNVADAA